MTIRRLLAIGALTGVAIAASTTSATAQPSDPASTRGAFTALTYNVAGLPEQISGSEPSTNSPLISPLLNGYDVVLLQEDWVDVFRAARDAGADDLPPLTGYHHLIVGDADHPHRSTPADPPYGTDASRAPAGPALTADGLNRLSDIPFGDVIRRQWTACNGELVIEGVEVVTDAAGLADALDAAGLAGVVDGGASDCGALKGFSVATLTLAPGAEVDVYNLHADAGSSIDDIAARRANFDQLAAFIGQHSVGHAVIVGGDTNLKIDDDRPERAADADVWSTFQVTTGVTDVCRTIDCGADDAVIDKFAFRSGDAVTLAAATHRFERDVFQDASGDPLSDHDALAVEFTWDVAAAEAPSASTAAEPVAEPTTDPTTTSPTSTPAAHLPVTGSTSPAALGVVAGIAALAALIGRGAITKPGR
ncbi:MAG: endonuclease/exonuclease/phosphatase family protein [Acidimicrobiales bacterium]|nr:endonuclease/exonuclease/phosphatase family protein [Acidimicrobiales bacterium]